MIAREEYEAMKKVKNITKEVCDGNKEAGIECEDCDFYLFLQYMSTKLGF